MSSFWRITLLGLFGAAGIGLALCVALSSQSSAEAMNDGTPTTMAEPASGSAKHSSSWVEQTHPRIAQQSASGNPRDVQLAQTMRTDVPVGDPGSPQLPATPPQPASMTQAEVMEHLQRQLQQALQGTQGANSGSASTSGKAATSLPLEDESPATSAAARPNGPGANAAPAKSKPRITRLPGEGDNNLSINIQDSDLRDVLQLLSEQGGLNILPSPNVQGKVSASLNGVNVDTALAAILRSTGYVARYDGKFIYVGTPQDFKSMEQAADTIGTRVYHLNYVRAADAQALVTGLLTPAIGSISVTAPANEGIAADSSKAGGNQYAGNDAIVVRDFVAVLDQIDQVLAEIDHRPAQVAIEAMILRVTLKDEYSFGVDFELLRSNPAVRFATGNPIQGIGEFDVGDGGLKFAYLDGSTTAFVSALETLGETNVIATPKLTVVDKARAEVLIGRQLGYVNTTITETSTAQNVQFLEVGTQLRIRPFVSSDGMIRMEVHPELSDGNVEVRDGLTLPNKETTQVTTNIIVPDGCTVIIGGLLQDSVKSDTKQVPFFGSLPGIGFLFRDKKETIQKEEVIVLITPHLICEPDVCCEGDKAAAEFHRRQAVYSDQTSPLGKRYLGRKYYRLAQAAWAKGDQKSAMKFIDLSVHFDPMSRAAISLRTDIWNGNLVGEHTLMKPGMFAPHGDMMPMPGGFPAGPGEGEPMLRELETLPPGRLAPSEMPEMNSTGSASRPDRRGVARLGPPMPVAPVILSNNMTATAPQKLPAGATMAASPIPLTERQAPELASSRRTINAPPSATKPTATSGAMDAAALPNWMVDGLMQTSGSPSQSP